MKARKKPVLVDAWQLPSVDKNEFIDNLPDDIYKRVTYFSINGSLYYLIDSIEGVMRANAGDYLIYGGHDDVWVIRQYIFEKTYETVEVKE